MHFAKPDFFESIVPEWFPDAKLANRISGAAEIILGLGMLAAADPTRVGARPARPHVVVFPANVDMAINKVEVKPVDGSMTRSVGTVTGPQNWIRLPMQVPLAWWLWREARAAA